MRLAACWPKDGVGRAVGMASVEEVVLRIVTSLKARNALLRGLEE